MMHSIQTDISEQALVSAIRGNLCAFFRYLSCSLPQEDHLENDRFARWYTPLSHPWFNGLLCSVTPTQADGELIRDTIQFFSERRVGVFTFWLDSNLDRSEWSSILSANGFGFSDDTPGMAIDLHSLPASAPLPQGLEIRTVEDESAMRVWAHVFTLGYGLSSNWEVPVFDLWLKLGLNFPVRNYLGFLDGNPVSTSTIFYGAGVTGIYDVATLPEARGRGIGTALTLAPLLDARQAGYRIGSLQSSDMGYGVYKKMGFRHLCQIENFYYQR